MPPKAAWTPAAIKEMEKLGELFKFFKLTPRVSDPLTDTPRNILVAVRDQEREIMRIAIKMCGMPRKDFIATFQGSRDRRQVGQPPGAQKRLRPEAGGGERNHPAPAAPNRPG